MHPIQDIETDDHGILRFKENKIVTYLLDNGPYDMNDLAVLEFSQEDREQFAQLIGYSLCGFSELSYTSDEIIESADKMAEGKRELEARNEYLRQKLENIKEKGAELTTELYNIHPDDLKG